MTICIDNSTDIGLSIENSTDNKVVMHCQELKIAAARDVLSTIGHHHNHISAFEMLDCLTFS